MIVMAFLERVSPVRDEAPIFFVAYELANVMCLLTSPGRSFLFCLYQQFFKNGRRGMLCCSKTYGKEMLGMGRKQKTAFV